MAYTHMVALGSSFAAGPGLEPVDDRAARRSARNYPHLVAESLGSHLVDATVSGATTGTILDVPQRSGRRKFPPQINSVHPDADLVTVTAAGNDIGYIGGILGRAVVNRVGRPRPLRPIRRRLRARYPLADVAPERARAAADGLVRIVEAIHQRAPAARVFLVGYLPLFSETTVAAAGVPFDAAEIDQFRRTAEVLSAVYTEAGSRSGAEVLHSADYDQSHTLGTTDPWVFGLRSPRTFASSFHPTPGGMRAVADLILTRITEPRPDPTSAI